MKKHLKQIGRNIAVIFVFSVFASVGAYYVLRLAQNAEGQSIVGPPASCAGGGQCQGALGVDSQSDIGVGAGATTTARLYVYATGTAYSITASGTLNILHGTLRFPDGTTQSTAAVSNSTMSAANISAGTFGSNTGGGNYLFPANVGIGGYTTYPLDVTSGGVGVFGSAAGIAHFGQDRTNYKGIGLGYDTTSQTGVIFSDTASAASNIAFWAYNGSAWGEKMRVTGAGNVGIATTTPSQALTVSGSILATGGIFPNNQTTYGLSGNDTYADTLNSGVVSDPLEILYRRGSGVKVCNGAGNGTDCNIIFNASGNSYFNGGNVGIGTASPGYKLHVVGASNFAMLENTDASVNAYAQLGIKAGTATSYLWTANQNSSAWGGPNSLNIYAGTGGAMTFYTNAVETMRITSGGSVGIGTTAPGQKLSVAGTIESTTGGVKFPDGTTQTTAYLGTSATINAANVSAGSFGANTGGGVYTFPSQISSGGQGRFSGWYVSGGGLAAEIGVSAGTGYVMAYDRTAGTYAPMTIQSGANSITFSSANGYATFAGNLVQSDHSNSTVGVYDPTKLSQIWAMGNAYTIPAGGASQTQANGVYALVYSYNPDYGAPGNNPGAISGFGHQIRWVAGNSTQTAIGTGVWTAGPYEQAAANYMYPGYLSGQGTGTNTTYYLAGSTSWGLYSNTSLNAQGLYDTGNRVCSSSSCSVGTGTFTTNVTGGDVYSNGWLRNNAASTGLYNQVNGYHWYSDGTYWSSTAPNGILFRNGYAGAAKFYVYTDGTNFGFLNSAGGWAVEVVSGVAGGYNVSIPNGTLNMGNHQINAVATPTASTDAATKGYVDTSGSTQFMGYSAATTGSMGGIVGANAKCNTAYAGSHMCTQGEIIRSGVTSLPSPGPGGYAWIACDLVNGTTCSGPTYSYDGGGGVGNDPNCNQWNGAYSGFYGPGIYYVTGQGGQALCTTSMPIACCK